MFSIKLYLLAPSKVNYNFRYLSTNAKVIRGLNSPPTLYFFSKVLGLNSKRCAKMLEKHKELFDVSRKDILNSVESLKSLKYTVDDIERKPMILYTNSLTLENRHVALQECGCDPIPISVLSKYVTVMNKNVSMLKSYQIIPYDLDVQKNLEKCFTSDININLNEKIDENNLLKNIRQTILNVYLTEKLQMTKSDLEKQWKTYSRLRHKSFQSIIKMINILINEMNFPISRIIKNGYLIYGDPDNLEKMLKEIKKIGNDNFKEILYRRPKIMMSSCDGIKQTIEHIKNFGISEDAIPKCIEVLTLGPDTVLGRLEDLKNVEELEALVSNPRVLRLVHYQTKALRRLEYLNKLKVKCASLNILSCGSDAFAKFARDASDRTKGRDVVVYLAHVFQKSENDVRNFLSRHPNWCHIPVVQLKQCLETLVIMKFNLEDIYENIHILLYPITKIEEKIKLLQGNEIYEELHLNTNYKNISYSKILTLCLYLIESEFHYTGDGVWTDHHINTVENFNNLLADFPEGFEKVYKYGVKPAANNKEKQVVI